MKTPITPGEILPNAAPSINTSAPPSASPAVTPLAANSSSPATTPSTTSSTRSPPSLAHAINQWLTANSDLLPKSLALDGKNLGGKGKLGALVTLCHHHTGAPLVIRTYSGDKNDCELPVSQTLLKQVAPVLVNAVI